MDFNYLDLEQERGRKIKVWPVPYEATVSFSTGTRNGPLAMLQASCEIETWDEELETDLADCLYFRNLPFFQAPVAGPKQAQAEMLEFLQKELDPGKDFLLTLGGEHSVALAPISAYLRHYPGLAVLQLDAHADLRSSFQGSPYSHASVMARVAEKDVLMIQIGLRSLCREESEIVRRNSGGKMLPFFSFGLPSPREAAQRILEFIGDRLLYISFDADALDPSILPGTGTPEPGGLSYEWVQSLWPHLLPHVRLLGLDFCEVSPLPSCGVVSESVAVKCINRILASSFCFIPGGGD